TEGNTFTKQRHCEYSAYARRRNMLVIVLFVKLGVGVHRRSCQDRPSRKHRGVIDADGVLCLHLSKLLRREATSASKMHEFAVEGIDTSEYTAAERQKIAHDCV